jgi:hypothetical protein
MGWDGLGVFGQSHISDGRVQTVGCRGANGSSSIGIALDVLSQTAQPRPRVRQCDRDGKACRGLRA